MSSEEEDDWSWTVAPAIPRDDGSVVVKVLAYDGESPTSYVYEHADVQAPPANDYEVEAWLSDLWMAPNGTLFAPGEEGRLHIRTKSRWTLSQSPTEALLTAAWAPDDHTCYVASERAVLRWSNGQWTTTIEGLAQTPDVIRGSADGTRLFVAGRAGSLLQYDGRKWAHEKVPTHVDLNGLCVTGVVYAVGDDGVIVRGVPGHWELLATGTEDLQDVVELGGAIHVASGEGGVSRLVDGALQTTLESAALRLRTSSRFLCAAGATAFHRFDGQAWLTRQYKL